MTTSENNKLAEELAKSLDSATKLMQDLLGDIKDNGTSLALVKARLESLGSSVESLSHIVRDENGKGSLITRLALMEKSVEDIEDSFDKFQLVISEALKDLKEEISDERKSNAQDEKTEKEYKREKMLAKLKIAVVISPGIIALVIVIIKMLMGEAPTPTP